MDQFLMQDINDEELELIAGGHHHHHCHHDHEHNQGLTQSTTENNYYTIVNNYTVTNVYYIENSPGTQIGGNVVTSNNVG